MDIGTDITMPRVGPAACPSDFIQTVCMMGTRSLRPYPVRKHGIDIFALRYGNSNEWSVSSFTHCDVSVKYVRNHCMETYELDTVWPLADGRRLCHSSTHLFDRYFLSGVYKHRKWKGLYRSAVDTPTFPLSQVPTYPMPHLLQGPAVPSGSKQ